MTEPVQFMEPPLQPIKTPRRRLRAFWRKSLLVFLFLFVAGCTALLIFAGSLSKALTLAGISVTYVKDKALQVPPFHGQKQVNILLIGTDVSFGDSTRTDTIKLIHLDLEQQRIAVLSIPRDTWVKLPDDSYGRINSAHALGGKNGQVCVAMAKTAVETLITDLDGRPIHIDRFVRVQTDRFVKLIDALGGINLDVEKKMDYEDPSQDLFIHLEPGLQHLDGTQAMGYVRFRHDAEGDYGRIRRQDQFLRTLMTQIRTQEKSQRLATLRPLLDMVLTDLSVTDALGMKKLVEKLGMDGLQTAQLPTVPTRKGRAEVVEVEDREAAAQTLRDVLDGPRTTVAVINGTTRSGIAREAGEQIDASTYQLIGVGTSKQPALTSMIITDDAHRPMAVMLATQLGISVIDSKISPPVADFGKHPSATPAQITVVLGSDFGKTTNTSANPITQ